MKKYYCNQCPQEFTRRWNLQRHTTYMHSSLNVETDIFTQRRNIQKDAGYVESSYNWGSDLPEFTRRWNTKRYTASVDYSRNLEFHFAQNLVSKNTSYQFSALPLSGQSSTDDLWKGYVLETLINILKKLREINSTLRETLLKTK